ncbi:Nuclear transcription factor Y subunit B-6 [Capsicum annuum]|uniref:Nuclear transcription factor Y subunit B-6 n=1 Tax=Capsicum annuum TaxID=4072 RepID=A0A2G2XYJ4_CAPAN|nr:Nuclear transcription factor Y subunit B-6 [Capsicum annuum]
MDLGGGKGGGGFHGYHRFPPTTSDGKVTEMNMNLSAQLNHAIPPTNHNNNNNYASVTDDSECTVREQDRFMPIANVIRIMRKILPPHAKISDDSKETIQECVSEFISFVTGEANDRCQREQRKTITAEDPRGVVVDPAASTSINANMIPINYPLPPNFTMAHHHHGYFTYAHMSHDNVASNSQANHDEANNVEE